MARAPEGPSDATFHCSECGTVLDPPEATAFGLWGDAWCPSCGKVVTALAEDPIDEEPDEETRASWPKSVDEAVERLTAELDPGDLDAIRAMERGELVELHFSLGMAVRNGFGLWQGNQPLLESCVQYAPFPGAFWWTVDPDFASSIILEALWLRLRTGAPAEGLREWRRPLSLEDLEEMWAKAGQPLDLDSLATRVPAR